MLNLFQLTLSRFFFFKEIILVSPEKLQQTTERVTLIPSQTNNINPLVSELIYIHEKTRVQEKILQEYRHSSITVHLRFTKSCFSPIRPFPRNSMIIIYEKRVIHWKYTTAVTRPQGRTRDT